MTAPRFYVVWDSGKITTPCGVYDPSEFGRVQLGEIHGNLLVMADTCFPKDFQCVCQVDSGVFRYICPFTCNRYWDEDIHAGACIIFHTVEDRLKYILGDRAIPYIVGNIVEA